MDTKEGSKEPPEETPQPEDTEAVPGPSRGEESTGPVVQTSDTPTGQEMEPGPSRGISAGSLNLVGRIDDLIANNKVVIFSKTTCPFCTKVKNLFMELGQIYFALELDQIGYDGFAIQDLLYRRTNRKTVPQVFVNSVHVGGCDDVYQAHDNGTLEDLLLGRKYDFDLVVIGGGSGGIAMAKEAADLGRKVCLCDFVSPTPKGTDWGLGGTCVNVGCIPKKLMHQAALIGKNLEEASLFGWEMPTTSVQHNWETMVTNVQNYIKSLNFGYRKILKEKKVTYKNAMAKVLDPHTVEIQEHAKDPITVSAKHIAIACGGRPTYPQIPGAREFGITSDDLFSLKHNPGKTVIVGASYIALECAGFLRGLGYEVTVMVRSLLLRGFDQQMAEMIGDHMKSEGIKFIRPCVPCLVEEICEGSPGLYRVYADMLGTKEVVVEECNTIIFAIGRTASTEILNLESLGIEMNIVNRKIIVNEWEQTSVPNIFAIGDVAHGRLELTPVAIQAGVLLAKRLYGDDQGEMDYRNIPTTVFTPFEYGSVGFSEEDAMEKYGPAMVEVYHSHFNPLELALSGRSKNTCYVKIVCLKSRQEKVVGLHIFGPNAGEVTQGFALAVKLQARKVDFAKLIGIHPTNAEIFTTLDVTKSSGASIDKSEC